MLKTKALGRGVWNTQNSPGIEAEPGPRHSSGYLLGLLATSIPRFFFGGGGRMGLGEAGGGRG